MRRREALQWFYDRGAVLRQLSDPDAPSAQMMTRMEADGQLELSGEGWVLTDKGRRDLHEGNTR